MLEYLLQLWPRSLTSQALIVGVVVGVSVYFLSKKRYKMPPNPRGWPIIGNALGRYNISHYILLPRLEIIILLSENTRFVSDNSLTEKKLLLFT